MVYVAMLYKYIDVMLYMIIALSVIILMLHMSIKKEEKMRGMRYIKSIKIINNVSDPRVLIRELTPIPGTDSVYTPKYGYYKDGVFQTTYFYHKCKRNTK